MKRLYSILIIMTVSALASMQVSAKVITFEELQALFDSRGIDITMLDEADYSFCPADGVIAHRYENVCKCADGAVAEVIFEKIPAILGIKA